LTDLDSEISVITSDKLHFLSPDEKGKKDKLSEHHVHVRLMDEREPDDLQIGAQNPLNLNEWKLFKVKDYGKWFQKEIDLYIRKTSGL